MAEVESLLLVHSEVFEQQKCDVRLPKYSIQKSELLHAICDDITLFLDVVNGRLEKTADALRKSLINEELTIEEKSLVFGDDLNQKGMFDTNSQSNLQKFEDLRNSDVSLTPLEFTPAKTRTPLTVPSDSTNITHSYLTRHA